MKKAFFKDPDVQHRFDRDGYVVIDFTTPEVVQQIADLFYAQHPTIPPGFFCEVSNTNDALKQAMFRQMDEQLADAMESTFTAYKKLGATFLCKAPGTLGKVDVHQDWTAVDESIYSTATIWIPTQDVDDSNGALKVMPGSHLFFDKYRNNFIPVSYRGSEQLLWDNMLTVPMKAGQAFILNHAVLHASSPNLTDKERLVIAYGVTSKEAPLRFYFRAKEASDNRVEKFDMPDDFFLRYHNIGERPLIGKAVETFDYDVPQVSTVQIADLIEKARTERQHIPFYQQHWHKPPSASSQPQSWWQRLIEKWR